MRRNLDAIQRELCDGPLVWRYLPHETDDGLDGQEEGAFTLLSFWLAGNLIYTGQNDKALDYFHEVLTSAPTTWDCSPKCMTRGPTGSWATFPQAYSHIGLIHTALNLSGFIADTPTRRINPFRKRVVSSRPSGKGVNAGSNQGNRALGF